MNLTEKMDNYNKRWGIHTQLDHKEEFKKFKTRVLNSLKYIDQYITPSGIHEFCLYYAIEIKWHTETYKPYSTNIIDQFTKEEDEIEFYRMIEVLFTLDFIYTTIHSSGAITRKVLYHNVSKAIEFSPKMNVTITEKNGEVILHPKGEKILDEELVNQPLTFLNPEARAHFISALKYYQENKPIQSGEALRRTLEEFLKHKFNNQLGLATNIEKLNRDTLEKQKTEIKNIFTKTINYLDKYFNNHTKHADSAITEEENEYLIYQTGTLLRYINRIP